MEKKMQNMILLAMLAMTIISTMVSATTLVDHDDFESYANETDMLTGSQWYCSNPPSCVTSSGSATADWQLAESGGNHYLSMYAIGYSPPTSASSVSLIRNMTGLSGIGSDAEHWYTLQFYIKSYATYSPGLTTNMPNIYAYMTESYYNGAGNINFNIYNSNYLNGIKLGGYYNNSVPSEAEWDNVRFYHDIILSHVPHALPYSTPCDISDLDWHLFTKQYKFEYVGGNRNLTEERDYIDSTLCWSYNYTGKSGFNSNAYPFSQLSFLARNSAVLSIDDIKLYDGIINASVTQCNDGIDNDGDGFTDFPSDPSCDSLSDNTESPFDYTACDNGLDDDNDGYIDLDDPHCDNATDNSEAPSDATVQPETACLTEEMCLLYDKFPYNDNISLHGWTGNTAFFSSDMIYSNQRLNFDNLGFLDFNFSKNITNANKYNSVTASFSLYFDNLFESETPSYNYYTVIRDADGREVIRLRFDLSRGTATSSHILVQMYYYNGTAYNLLAAYEPYNSDVLSRATFIFDINQVLKTFNITVTGDGGLIYNDSDQQWTDVYANKVNSIGIEQGNFSSTKWEVVMDDVSIFGSLLDHTTTCDTWDLPYYLVESFNGYLSECGWLTSNYIFTTGSLQITDSIPYYYAQKDTDLATEDNTDYVTMSFDLNVINITHYGSTITFRLYDSDGYNFMTAYFRDTGNYLLYNDDGQGKVAGSITLNTIIPYKFVIDLNDNSWDIYINGSKVVTGSDFADAFVNVKNIQSVKITASDANFKLDNLKIYGSDSDGTPLLPDESLEPEIDEDYLMCGHFLRNPSSCSTDEDCPTGKCGINHECSSFDYTYCDENGMTRGNKCLLSAVTKCTLSSTGDIILNNFFLFLVLLILVMGAVYLYIMFKRN